MTTIRELIDNLQSNYNLDATIVVAGDAEGNSYSAVDAIDVSYAEPGADLDGRVEELLSAEDIEDYDESVEDYTEVVVIWPV